MRTKVFFMIVASLLILLAACGPAATPEPTQSPTLVPEATETAPLPVIHFELGGDPDAGDIPRYMAVDSLRAQGYTVETASFAETSMTVVALDQEDLDFANLSNADGLVAIEQGAELVLILDDARNTGIIVANPAIEQCTDLDGARIGVNALTGTRTTMLYQYIERNCPGTEPEYLVMAGSSARAAALLAGEIDAAVLDVFDFIELEAEQPGELHTLVAFSDEFPGLTTLSLFTRRGFAQEHPAAVEDAVQALLEARRRIQDPAVLAAEIEKYLELEPEEAQNIAEIYLEQEIWDVNSRYTPEAVQDNIDFLVLAGVVRPGLKVENVADLSFLENVLADIGRE